MSMIAEFAIIPIGSGESLSRYIAEALKIVESSGLKYELTATATILEGDFDQVMDVIKRCHQRVLSMSPRVMTFVRIDDRIGAKDEMERKVHSVEEKVGHELRTSEE